eukprot:GILI01003172.1.p1 GENE.GILI01003172.1~~GILI01003172.1.p1  ORF type:complete len:445 (+),score=141.47 GILI01003172.1:81-1337(+)
MSLLDDFESAKEVEDVQPDRAIALYNQVIKSPNASDEESVKVKEQAIYKLGELLAKCKRADDLRVLLTDIRPFFSNLHKAKTAKIVRTLIDMVAKIPNTRTLQSDLCLDCIAWCNTEKRTFLRQRIETRLASLYLEQEKFQPALELLTRLLRDVKKFDDKLLLVEIQLIESKVHHALQNLPKSKAALTSARSCANAIYCPPLLQSEIDMMAGTLHAEEKDYKTAYSYFYEAFEALTSAEDSKAVMALKYMLLCRIMSNNPEDVHSLIASKAGVKYAGPEVEAMKAVARAHQDRSLKLFEQTLKTFSAQLEQDPIINAHLRALYETLLEQNLCRIIEPFSQVEIAHVAQLIDLPVDRVQAKLSEMILDKKFDGTLDQGHGRLIVFDEPPLSNMYGSTLSAIKNMSVVVDSLYEKAQKLR